MDSVDNSDKEQKITRSVGRRRGRGPSKNPSLNRNALMARENRQRKKEYLQKIENKLAHLQTENEDLRLAMQRQDQENQKLKVEVNHLRAVMQNSTTVTKLLQAINDSLLYNTTKNTMTALSERLNTNDDNARTLRTDGSSRFNNSISSTSCAASSSSNEENSDPVYAQGEELISKLTSLVECSEVEESIESPVKKSKYQDHSYVWVKDEVLNNEGNMDQDFTEWANKKINILPLNSDKSEYIPEEFSVDSLFENLNDNTNSSLDQNQMENTFSENPDISDALLPSAGICIHVNKNKVSLEYCAECYSRVNDFESNKVKE